MKVAIRLRPLFFAATLALTTPTWAAPPCDQVPTGAPKVANVAELRDATIAESFNTSGAGSGFSCTRPAASKGKTLRCIGKVNGYPQPVAIIVPPNYVPTEKTDTVFYLHGWNSNPRQSLEQKLESPAFNLEHNFAATRRNELLIVPFSEGNCDDYKKALADPASFKTFTENLGTLSKAAGLSKSAAPGDLTLSGHSGAWDPIASILTGGARSEAIRDVFLFDSMAGKTDQFANWLRANPEHRLWTSVTQGNDLTVRNHALFMNDLDRPGAKVPYVRLSKPIPTASVIRSSRVGIVTSTADHNWAVNQDFTAFLSEDARLHRPTPSKN
jgi:hypothetical protein